jgi:hypothetical protein
MEAPETASVRYEFGIAVRSDSIRDLLDQIEPVGSKSHPVLDSSQPDTDSHNEDVGLPRVQELIPKS